MEQACAVVPEIALTLELKGPTPGMRLARKADDDSERFAGQVPGRWRFLAKVKGQASPVAGLRHCCADRLAHRDPLRGEAFQAVHIDAQVVRCDALAVECVDTADPAKVVARCLGVELVLGESFLAGQKAELALVHLDHQCVLAPADRAVAHGQLGEVRLDLEAHSTTVARSNVLLH